MPRLWQSQRSRARRRPPPPPCGSARRPERDRERRRDDRAGLTAGSASLDVRLYPTVARGASEPHARGPPCRPAGNAGTSYGLFSSPQPRRRPVGVRLRQGQPRPALTGPGGAPSSWRLVDLTRKLLSSSRPTVLWASTSTAGRTSILPRLGPRWKTLCPGLFEAACHARPRGGRSSARRAPSWRASARNARPRCEQACLSAGAISAKVRPPPSSGTNTGS